MAKKGKGSKKKQSKEDKKDSLPEVDKEYYEIQIADLNKKLNRLKTRCSELEKENFEVTKNYKSLDEDRAAALAYLKHKLEQKNQEMQDVSQRLQALQSAKDAEKDKYEEQITTMEKDYKTMQDQFHAEVKLLNGQLASLESFKLNRENMLKRLLELEDDLKKKDEHHALALRNNENKFILMKEKLSATVEEKLLQLSLDLQKQTQNRMAETTHNLVKENIAINNELNLIIGSWQKMFDENESLKENIKSLKQKLEIANELKEQVLEKNKVQFQAMDRLMYNYTRMQEQYSSVFSYEENNKALAEEAANYKKQVEGLNNKLQRLEVKYHTTATELQELKLNFKLLQNHNHKLEETIKDAVMIIKDVIGLQQMRDDETDKSDEEIVTARKQLLNALLELFDNSSLIRSEELSIDRMGSQDSMLANDWIRNSATLRKCPFLKKGQTAKEEKGSSSRLN